MTLINRPRRSVLYMPGSNPRALAKGQKLHVDSIIMDLEDAVSPENKSTARDTIAAALSQRSLYGKRELVIRVNGLDSEWGTTDLEQMGTLAANAIVLPKIENASMVDDAMVHLPSNTSIWCMIETPRGVMHAEEIANHPNVHCLVMGTSDLTKDLRSLHTPKRMPMLTSLSWCLLAARAANVAILDGVHLDLNDAQGFQESCLQGLELGFDGKTLIHPNQIDTANQIFAPSDATIEWSRKIIQAFEASIGKGQGVVVVDGKLVENLHVADAKRLLELNEMISELHIAA